MTAIEMRRITTGPTLLVEAAEALALEFFANDPSSMPGGYDDLAGRGEPDRITKSDVVAINTTIRARSPLGVWDPLISSEAAQERLVAIDSTIGSHEEDDRHWASAHPNIWRGDSDPRAGSRRDS